MKNILILFLFWRPLSINAIFACFQVKMAFFIPELFRKTNRLVE